MRNLLLAVALAAAFLFPHGATEAAPLEQTSGGSTFSNNWISGVVATGSGQYNTTVGNRVTVTVNGHLGAIRLYRASGATGAIRWSVWDDTPTLLATGVFNSVGSTPALDEQVIDPVNLVTGHTYTLAYDIPSGATGTYFNTSYANCSSSPINQVGGHLVLNGSGTCGKEVTNTSAGDVPAYPTASDGSLIWGIDARFFDGLAPTSTPTATGVPSATATAAATATATPTRTATATSGPTDTPSATPTTAPTNTATVTRTPTPSVTPTVATSTDCDPSPEPPYFLAGYEHVRDVGDPTPFKVRITAAMASSSTFLCAWTVPGNSFSLDASGAGISVSGLYVSSPDSSHGQTISLAGMATDTDLTVTTYNYHYVTLSPDGEVAVEAWNVSSTGVGVLTAAGSCIGDALAWNPSWPCYSPATATATATRTATGTPLPTNTPPPPTATSNTCTGRASDPCYVIAPTSESMLSKIATAIAVLPAGTWSAGPVPTAAATSSIDTAAIATAWSGAGATVEAHFPIVGAVQTQTSTLTDTLNAGGADCETWPGIAFTVPHVTSGPWAPFSDTTLTIISGNGISTYWCHPYRDWLAAAWLWLLGIDILMIVVALVREHGK